MNNTDFLQRLNTHIEHNDFFPRASKIVVGVSGGVDSTVLLHALDCLRRTRGLKCDLHVAHLNHLIRGEESCKDAAFVASLADDRQLPKTIERCDIPAIQKRDGGSLEEIARRERFAFFERVCTTVGATHLALGHHADDNVETVLHRLMRGTGLKGLAGISQQRRLSKTSDVIIVRPLLPFSRNDILEFALAQGLSFRNDSTNALLDSTRNRIRNELLPHLEETFNPKIRDAIGRLAKQSRWTTEFVRVSAASALTRVLIDRDESSITLDRHHFCSEPMAIKAEIIRLANEALNASERNLTFEHVCSVIELTDRRDSGKLLSLPDGVCVRLAYDKLVMSRGEHHSDPPTEFVELTLPGTTEVPSHALQIDCSLVDSKNGSPSLTDNRFEEWVDLSSLTLPLVIRTCLPGDRFHPLGSSGSKKLARFMIDSKVEPDDRPRVPVVCDQSGPIWLVGYRIDERVKLTSSTRTMLHMKAARYDEPANSHT